MSRQDGEILFVVPKIYGDEDQTGVRLVDASNFMFQKEEQHIDEIKEKFKKLEIKSYLTPYITEEQYREKLNEIIENKKSNKKLDCTPEFKFSGEYGHNLMEEISRYAMLATYIALQYDFDIIHAHDWLTLPAGMAAKHISGKPLIAHIHATEFDRSGEHINQDVYNIERRGMEEADKVLTVSNYTGKLVSTRYGINPDKVKTIYNAVEHHPVNSIPYKKQVEEKVVTFLGRVTFQKGPDYFVEAANKVLQKTNNVRFVMAGSGDMINRMIKRVAELGIATRFHFTGFLKGDDVKKMYDMSDVYVMPSVSEPFGITPLEAMLSNVPVIISKQSGVSEILNHAIKVDFWDIDALADAIYGLLNYDALSTTFKSKGREEVQSLNWDNVGQKIFDAYTELLQQNVNTN